MAKESDPWFPFYAADFLSDAKQAALPADAAGVYIRLLAHSWIEGPLPMDREFLASLGGVSLEQFDAMWPRLARLWDVADDQMSHKRLEKERLKKNTVREKRVQAASKRHAHAVQMDSTCTANDVQNTVYARVTVQTVPTEGVSSGKGERERETMPSVPEIDAVGEFSTWWRAQAAAHNFDLRLSFSQTELSHIHQLVRVYSLDQLRDAMKVWWDSPHVTSRNIGFFKSQIAEVLAHMASGSMLAFRAPSNIVKGSGFGRSRNSEINQQTLRAIEARHNKETA